MSYEPTFPGDGISQQYLYEELSRIGTAMTQPDFHIFVVHHEPPAKPVEGMLICADGTDWNPGAGAGLYLRLSGAWTKL